MFYSCLPLFFVVLSVLPILNLQRSVVVHKDILSGLRFSPKLCQSRRILYCVVISFLLFCQQQQREFTSTHLQEVNKEHKQQLALQRQEYEGTIQRHLSFIDQLIDDKKVLSQRCEEVVKKLKETDQKYATKLKTLEEK